MDQPQRSLIAINPGDVVHFLREIYYKSVPSPVRSFIRGNRREVVFKNAMQVFLKDPATCAFPGHPVLLDLIYGWGNEAWSARDEYLAACINHTLSTTGPILECGSGLSSVLIGAIAKRRGQSHWILEHKPGWVSKVQNYLNDYGLDSLIITNPLKDYGDYYWYDLSLKEIPPSFSFVVCDGPPRRTKGGRYGLIPIMKEKLTPNCVILLDDANRKDELEIAARWANELSASFIIEGTVKPYIHMTLGKV